MANLDGKSTHRETNEPSIIKIMIARIVVSLLEGQQGYMQKPYTYDMTAKVTANTSDAHTRRGT